MNSIASILQAMNVRRVDMKMSKKDLAARAGVSRPALDRLLEGGDVHFSTVLAVAGVLGLDVTVVPRSISRALTFSRFQPMMPTPQPTTSTNKGDVNYQGPVSAVQSRLLRLRLNSGSKK